MSIKILLRPIKVYRLIGLLMTYVMGVGLARYLETMRSWPAFWTGAAFLLCVFLSFEYMQALQQINENKDRSEGSTQTELQQLRISLGVIAATLMTVAVTILVGWMVEGLLWQGLIILSVVIFAVGGVLIVKGTAQNLQPFLPLLEAVLIVVIPPAFGFFLQTQQRSQGQQ